MKSLLAAEVGTEVCDTGIRKGGRKGLGWGLLSPSVSPSLCISHHTCVDIFIYIYVHTHTCADYMHGGVFSQRLLSLAQAPRHAWYGVS